MTDREVWLVVRRSLLFIVDVFDRRFGCGKYGEPQVIPADGPTTTLT